MALAYIWAFDQTYADWGRAMLGPCDMSYEYNYSLDVGTVEKPSQNLFGVMSGYLNEYSDPYYIDLPDLSGTTMYISMNYMAYDDETYSSDSTYTSVFLAPYDVDASYCPANICIKWDDDGTGFYFGYGTGHSGDDYTGNAVYTAWGTTKVPCDEWMFLQFKIVFHSTTGSIEIKKDGTTIESWTGLNTDAQSTGEPDGLLMYGNGGYYVLDCFQDIAINDATGTANNSWLPKVRVIAPTVMDAGYYDETNGDFTPNPEETAPEYGYLQYVNLMNAMGDADWGMFYTYGSTYGSWQSEANWYYSTAGAVGDKVSFCYDYSPWFANPEFIHGSVLGVGLWCGVQVTDCASREVKTFVRSSSTDYENSATHKVWLQTGGLKGNYQQICDIYEQNPATSSDWTVSDIYAVDFGLKIQT